MAMPSFTRTFHHKTYPAISPDRPELSAHGKVVLITGAGTGCGEATAVAFAQASAAVVVVCGRRLKPLEKVKARVESSYRSTKVVLFTLDVSNEESIATTFRGVKETVGPIDVVVNSAGHLSDKGTVVESSLSNFWTSMEVTVKGCFLVAQYFLKNRGDVDPVLISFSSLLTPMAAMETNAPASYAASKIAQGKMLEYVAAENAGLVRVYSVNPGIIWTDMSSKSINMSADPAAAKASNTWDDVNLPGHFCVWLSSKEGNVIPSGRYLSSNWDVDELKSRSKELHDDTMALTFTLPGWPWPMSEFVDP